MVFDGFYYIPKEKRNSKKSGHINTKFALRYLASVFLPFRTWLFKYDFARNFKPDIFAGLTVSAILIPQAMAYAFLVGLPPQMGLYAALPAVALGALFGSSKQVITGPVGIVSLLTLTVLLPFAEPGTPEYISLVITLAIGVGLVQIVLGLLRFGFIVRLIPHSVLLGFASAAAIIIGSTQVPALMGFKIEQQEHVFQTIIELIKSVPQMHLPTFIVGLLAFVFIFTLKRRKPSAPASLIAIFAGLLASFAIDFESLGIAVVGTIPASIPMPSFEAFNIDTITNLIGASVVIGLIGFVETFAIAKSIANKTKDKISANQELVGQGMANLGSGLFGGLPVSGSFSSTGVNFSAGARTGMAAIVVAVVAAVTLLFLTPALYYLPRTILAAVVIAGVLQMISIKKFKETFYISKTDGTVAILTFVTAFALKPDDAVLVGVILALALFMQRIMWAHVTEEGFDHKWGHILRGAGEKENIKRVRGMIVARIDMSVFYANTEYVIFQLEELYKKRSENEKIHMFVIDFSSVNYLDITALEALGEFFEKLRKDGVEIYGIYTKKEQKTLLKKSKELVGEINFVHNVAELHEEYKRFINS